MYEVFSLSNEFNNSGIIVSNSFIQTYSPTVTINLKSNYNGSTNYNISNSNTITLNLTGTILFSPNLTGSDTWHNISSPNSITVSSGVASGYNKMLDLGWSNSSNWSCTFDYMGNSNGRGGVLLASLTNTSNYDYNTYGFQQDTTDIYVNVHNGSTSNTARTSYTSIVYYNCKIVKSGTSLSFYINDTLISSKTDPLSSSDTVTIGLQSWGSTIQNLKNIIVKSS